MLKFTENKTKKNSYLLQELVFERENEPTKIACLLRLMVALQDSLQDFPFTVPTI